VTKPVKYFYKKAIHIPLYDGFFIIIFSNDLNRVCKLTDSNPENTGYLYGNFFTGFKYRGFQAFAVVYNFWRPTAKITLGVLVHEINHAANKLLGCRDIDADYNNDEAESYLKTWMGDEVQKFMKECKLW
jgi:hypothetical protein